MRLSDVRHQDRALSILRRALRSGRTHHAYLFEGPDGVGKEMAARGLAARLLCEDPDAEPDADACGRCQSCHLLSAGTHPDFHLIHRGLHKLHPDRTIRASKGLYLVVDVIRLFLIEPAATTPSLGRRRVFLIREAERMNPGAQNALLKTLEEPPGAACLILVTASAERLLPTIRSRCQRVPFGLLPPAFVQEQLATQHGLEPAAAQTLANLAGGRLGAAVHWHEIGLLEALDETGAALDRLEENDPESFGKSTVEVATVLATRTARASEQNADEALAAQLADDEPDAAKTSSKTIPTDQLRAALQLVLMLVSAVYRDALVARVAPDSARHLPPQRARADELAGRLSADRLEDCLRAVAAVERMLDQNVAPQLVGERLAIALTGAVPVE